MNKSTIIRNVEFHYPHLFKAHSPFGTEIWDVQVRTTEEFVADQLKSVGVNVKKHDDGYWHANIKRKTVNRKGEPNSPVTIVDAATNPWNPATRIGNGSKGNVKVFSYDYNMNGRKGVGVMLSAIQIVELEEFKGSDDVEFDVEESDNAEGF